MSELGNKLFAVKQLEDIVDGAEKFFDQNCLFMPLRKRLGDNITGSIYPSINNLSFTEDKKGFSFEPMVCWNLNEDDVMEIKFGFTGSAEEFAVARDYAIANALLMRKKYRISSL